MDGCSIDRPPDLTDTRPMNTQEKIQVRDEPINLRLFDIKAMMLDIQIEQFEDRDRLPIWMGGNNATR